MSPRKRLTDSITAMPPWKRRLVNAAAMMSAALVLTAALKPVIRPFAKEAMTQTLDSVYVLQQSYDRAVELDSLQHKHELEKIDTKLARMDSSVACLRKRKPAYCE